MANCAASPGILPLQAMCLSAPKAMSALIERRRLELVGHEAAATQSGVRPKASRELTSRPRRTSALQEGERHEGCRVLGGGSRSWGMVPILCGVTFNRGCLCGCVDHEPLAPDRPARHLPMHHGAVSCRHCHVFARLGPAASSTDSCSHGNMQLSS